ncbi:hypothetical protein SAMN04515647_1646 [Cohaesibacter sp. ES.047]|uniref:hypothetical protein n=1 Tax=Cohaesibacter sp. ES.047 TaxID=1798205 RepID=UPI000BB88BC8|nr:hypothetical protein [Cohaesibacter sp. ES.047]SNY91425.1 hypothetical protein SAMN04515647_1646 [Cohaesibacter sp. ES.047]
MLSETLLAMQDWFVGTYNNDGFSPAAAQRFADLLHAQSQKAKRLEAALLARTIPLTREQLDDPKIALFPTWPEMARNHQKNEG